MRLELSYSLWLCRLVCGLGRKSWPALGAITTQWPLCWPTIRTNGKATWKRWKRRSVARTKETSRERVECARASFDMRDHKKRNHRLANGSTSWTRDSTPRHFAWKNAGKSWLPQLASHTIHFIHIFPSFASTPDHTCTYLTDNFASHCAQVYNYHRLLSWDAIRGLHIDIFKVPTCCSCQIDGYREKFPPILESQSQSLYTVSSDSSSDYSDNDEAISYAPVLSTAKKHRYVKRKKLKRTNPANVGAYLSPPSLQSEYNGAETFKRKHISVSLANRAVDRKNNKADAVLVDSDDQTAVEEFVASPTVHHTIDRPIHVLPKPPNAHLPRLVSPQKVLIKRVNYNYHPIIDFFFRDRALKAAKAKESQRLAHAGVIS